MARRHLADRTPCAIAYHGNVVDLLEYLYEKDVHVDLMSDQTSCHVPYDGGYCPQGLTYEQRTEMLDRDPEGFRALVDKSLRRHYEMICKFHDRGTYFFDYGNSFLKAVFDAGVTDVCKNGENDLDGFVFPSLCGGHPGALPLRLRLRPLPLVLPVREGGGPGPDRRCGGGVHPLPQPPLSGLRQLHLGPGRQAQQAGGGHQCRILYQDAMGRMNIALKFNEMVRRGRSAR